jgi:P4 family phage/plasmid primase-like protien
MNPLIEQILRRYYTDGFFNTHVSMIKPKGKYQFDRQGLEEFFTEYCRVIADDTDTIVGIAEKPQYYLPVLADIDIKIREFEGVDLGDCIYSDTHTSQTIEVYQSVLRNIVEGCTDAHLLCVLLEKNMYRVTKNDTTYAKHGFHLHFPNLFLSKIDQEVHLIPRVQDELRNLRTFDDLGFENSGEMVDKACCKVPWLMYGSRKEGENMEPYLLTKIVNAEGNEVNFEDAFKRYRLFDMRERLVKIHGNVRELLPRILSIIPYGRETNELKHGLVCPLKEKIKKKETKKHTKISITESLKISAKLLPMLSQYRSEDRNEWMTVGWILFNIGESSSEALDQWLEFSSRDELNYDEATCIYEWERMTKKDLTLGTLRYYASVDNPVLYQEFKTEQTEQYIKDSLSGSHNDIAKALYAEYGNEFVCASVASKVWFQFVNHKWEEIEEGVFLRERISSEIVDKFTEHGKDLMTKYAASDDAEQRMFKEKLNQVQKTIANCKSAPFKNNIMRECMEVFYDKRFRQKLDTNPYIIAFKNGVYDLKTNTFRAGRPEDFLSRSMAIDYIEFDEADEQVTAVHDYLEKVFPDTSVRQYFMDQSSDVFVGGNHQKVVLFWTGEGDNAKSVTQTIFEKMLGELAIKFSTTLVTGNKTTTGAANPELARAGNGVRWAVLEEPDAHEQINIGTMKSLSGNDSYWARDLFEKGKSTREMTPMFKLIFICNKLPKMRNPDAATFNRIRVVPFESTFVRPGEPCPDTYAEQLRQKRFPMDKQFARKIPELVQAFAWVLLQHRQKITIRIEPEKVQAATAMYRKQNDLYRQFVEECILEDDYSLPLSELYLCFKEWYREGFPGNNVPVKNEVKEYFSRLWDEPTRGIKWHGYRLKTQQDDIDDGTIVILGDDDFIVYDEDDEEDKEDKGVEEQKYGPPL